MAKSKKKRVKVERLVGSTAMDVVKEPAPSDPAPVAAEHEGMDTSEIIVTDSTPAPKQLKPSGRVKRKRPQKRKAQRLRQEKALMKAMSMIDKEERRVTKAELKKYGKEELKRME